MTHFGAGKLVLRLAALIMHFHEFLQLSISVLPRIHIAVGLLAGVSVGMVGEIWDKLMTRERREVPFKMKL